MFSSERPRGDRRGAFRRLRDEGRIDLPCVTPQGTTRTGAGGPGRTEAGVPGWSHAAWARMLARTELPALAESKP